MEKRKIYGTIVGALLFVLLILGITYAYFYWSSTDAQKTNVNLTVTKGLEGAIVYNPGTSILETANKSLEASDSYADSDVNATIEFWKTSDQDICGQLYLDILKMLSATGSSDANIGKTDTIKWAVTTYNVNNTTEVLLQEGTFNGRRQGDKFAVTDDIQLNQFQTFYKIYLWMDAGAFDGTKSVINELLSVEISASASDVCGHYGIRPEETLALLGLDDEVKFTTPDFGVISPKIVNYSQNIATNQTVSLTSDTAGDKRIGTGISFSSTTGNFTLSGSSTGQTYDTNAVGKYTCNNTDSSCSTAYKILEVKNGYVDSGWSTYDDFIMNEYETSYSYAVASSVTFDGTYFQLNNPSVVSVNNVKEGDITCFKNTGVNCTFVGKISYKTGSSGTSYKFYCYERRRILSNTVVKADIYTGTSNYNQDDIGLFKSEDDLGTSYYFRGNVENNYVYFGGYYWRIIRINGDGSIRMIYDGTSAHANGTSSTNRRVTTSAYKSWPYDLNTYVGYMYGNGTATSYADTHSNTTNSTIKTTIDNWYVSNILDTDYENYLADTVYCNDRSLSSGTGIGSALTIYGADERIYDYNPSLECINENDRFTVTSSLGNRKLIYPIAMITADEVLMAGGGINSGNSYNYLNIGSVYFTMSPSEFHDISFSSVFSVNSGAILNWSNASTSYGVRPVISIRGDAIVEGTGTMTDPFMIYQIGDVNRDGVITNEDSVLVMKHVYKVNEFTDDEQFFLADIDGNGEVDSDDWTLLNQMIA